MKPKLTLTFDAGFGERYSMCIDVGEYTARQFTDVSPPDPIAAAGAFEAVVETLRVKQLRKDVFVGEARRLGALLAERMEDAEGWHDVSRIEPAKKELAG